MSEIVLERPHIRNTLHNLPVALSCCAFHSPSLVTRIDQNGRDSSIACLVRCALADENCFFAFIMMLPTPACFLLVVVRKMGDDEERSVRTTINRSKSRSSRDRGWCPFWVASSSVFILCITITMECDETVLWTEAQLAEESSYCNQFCASHNN